MYTQYRLTFLELISRAYVAIIFYVADLYCVYRQKPLEYMFSFLQTSDPAKISHDTSGTNSQTNEGATQIATIPIVGDILSFIDQFIFVALWAVNGVSINFHLMVQQ